MKRALLLGMVALVVSGCGASEPEARKSRTAAEIGEPSDDIDPELIGSAVRGSSAHFQMCYEAGRERNPELMGMVEVRFLVNPDGSIGDAAIVDTDLPARVTDCVIQAFYGLRLPRQDAAVVAQYPMHFQPS
jgi:hypothetical protein